jgi:L-rhamnose mutarotase
MIVDIYRRNMGGKCPRSRGEVNARWQRDMAPYFTELDGLPPDQGFKRVDEIFHVD